MGANVGGLPAALLACSLLPASGKRLFGISIRGILPGIIRHFYLFTGVKRFGCRDIFCRRTAEVRPAALADVRLVCLYLPSPPIL